MYGWYMTDEKLNRIANQLLGDLEQAQNDEQRLQLLTDAFEQVASLAVDDYLAKRQAILEALTHA